MPEKHIFRVTFVNQNQVYEIYAKRVYQGDWYGFIVIEDFVFGETSAILVDPGEEKLKTEFEGVKRCMVPMHEVIRIDVVAQRGTAKILPLAKESSDRVARIYSGDKPSK